MGKEMTGNHHFTLLCMRSTFLGSSYKKDESHGIHPSLSKSFHLA